MDKKSLKVNLQTSSEENFLKWDLVQENLKNSLGAQIYESWLKNIRLIKEYNHFVILGVQTRFFRDWITSRYADKILDEIRKHKLSINRLEFKVQETRDDNKTSYTQNFNNVSEIKNSVLNYNRLKSQGCEYFLILIN